MAEDETCPKLIRLSKDILWGEPHVKTWQLGPRCALHVDNPCAEGELPPEMSWTMKDYMSKIAVGYPETDWMALKDEIGVELPSPKEHTSKVADELKEVGCRVTAIHKWEVDHIHAMCPPESAEGLFKLIGKVRFCRLGEK
ncbi:MAG: hypothetical protein AB1665_09235 [Candidatus Thermoplasmatota archaeon]